MDTCCSASAVAAITHGDEPPGVLGDDSGADRFTTEVTHDPYFGRPLSMTYPYRGVTPQVRTYTQYNINSYVTE